MIGRVSTCIALVLVVGSWPSAVRAQGKSPAAPDESLDAWQYFLTVQSPPAGPGKYADFLVPTSVFDRARADLADLRLRDSNQREIPYALRIRRPEDKVERINGKIFNHVKKPDHSDEMSLDLGEAQVTHNEMIVPTSGGNFRRKLRLEGSDTRNGGWNVLAADAELLHFDADGRTLNVNHVRYPVSRFRYLRVHVFPDPAVVNDSPAISEKDAAVLQSTQIPGQDQTLTVSPTPYREPVQAGDGYGSAWTIDLGGHQVPCSRLSLQINNDAFVRNYRLELVPDDEFDMRQRAVNSYGIQPLEKGMPADRYQSYNYPGAWLASGQLRRRAGVAAKPIEIRFPEVSAHRLRLVVTDGRNPPLEIRSVEFSAAAREVIFERSAAAPGPVLLYFGNPYASLPSYDFASELPATLKPAPARAPLDNIAQDNPTYHPLPKPWTERSPWVIYLILGAASLTLLLLLGLLAREAMRRHDAIQQPA